MNTTELLWFTVGIAGFVMVLEGTITYIAGRFFKKANLNAIKAIAGVIIYVIAVIALIRMS